MVIADRPDVRSGNNAGRTPDERTHVAVKVFSVFYRANQAVKDVTFNIPAGYVTAIIGPSGCGKSTILRAINRMNDPVPGCYVKGELSERIDHFRFDPQPAPQVGSDAGNHAPTAGQQN
ncbi:MAG: ATP-binding cassette domain-containing protein, partial [Verrucomicrobia bacterium]|nr:ATP-binding cassette domain-containing protein [Verrucomicrobiota bacterium]